MADVLAISGLCHAYGRNQVLRNLSLTLAEGEILGVIGENGAGKSTLVKCILGMVRPSAGRIDLRCSAAAIHQELNLAGDLPAYANFFLGRELKNRLGLLDIPRMAARTRAGLARLGVAIDPAAETQRLSVSERQMLEIARALDIDAGLLILDEPSALLNGDETARLFALMRRLREGGTSMIYISHKLSEVHEVCDRVAVLRDGELVGAGRAADLSPREMAEMMVGRPLANIYPAIPPPSEGVALSFDSAAMGSFRLRAGEILGVAGLADAGQVELGETLAGFRGGEGARVAVAGRPVGLRSPAAARRAGIGFLSADRLASGVWRDFTVAENIALGSLGRMAPGGIVSARAVAAQAEDYIGAFNVRCQGGGDSVGALSGGNQQKVSIAKVLADSPAVVVLNEPTQGVDVGARQEIYDCIARLASSGLAILLVSSDLPELLGLCRRILVMRAGRIAGEVSGDDLNERAIIRLATGTA